MTAIAAPISSLPATAPVSAPLPAASAPFVVTPELLQSLTQLTQALSGLVDVLQGAQAVQGGGPEAQGGCSCCAGEQAVAGTTASGAAAAPTAPVADPAPAAPTPAPAPVAAKPALKLDGAAPSSLAKPLDKFSISDHWGVVSGLRGSRPHSGLDMAAPSGTPIHAAAAGKVVKVVHSQGKEGLGTYVIIEHPGKLFTAYGHQSATNAKEGDIVKAGQEIGKVGSTGFSTGPHLHFEVRPGSANAKSVDPEKYFR